MADAAVLLCKKKVNDCRPGGVPRQGNTKVILSKIWKIIPKFPLTVLRVYVINILSSTDKPGKVKCKVGEQMDVSIKASLIDNGVYAKYYPADADSPINLLMLELSDGSVVSLHSKVKGSFATLANVILEAVKAGEVAK